MVLEGMGRRAAPEGVRDGVELVHAAGEGDDTLVEVAAAAATAAASGAGGGGPVTVVTADRALGERLRTAGVAVVGPRWLLDRLDA
jgi:rRNA-processing protein FCF1